MEIKKMIHDTEQFTKRVHELLGPQVFGDASTLVAELCRVVGVLSEGVLVTEGKRPSRPGTPVYLAHDIADVLYILISISNYYNIDLEHTWNEWVQQTLPRLNDEAFVTMIHERVSLARASRQKNDSHERIG
jgi:hypothetical protein